MRIVWYKRAYERFLQVSAWYAENMGQQAALKFERDTCPSCYKDERVIKNPNNFTAMIMASNYIRFDWAMKRLLRNNAKFEVDAVSQRKESVRKVRKSPAS